jgi:hypothetical protein
MPAKCRNPEIKLKKRPTEYLNQLYFDALVFSPKTCATLWADRREPGLARLGSSAARLFGMKA